MAINEIGTTNKAALNQLNSTTRGQFHVLYTRDTKEMRSPLVGSGGEVECVSVWLLQALIPSLNNENRDTYAICKLM